MHYPAPFRMPKRRESGIQAACVKAARDAGWIAGKIDRLPGWPDFVFLGPDKAMFWVEFKRPDTAPKPHQDDVHQKFNKHGVLVHVISDVTTFKRLLGITL